MKNKPNSAARERPGYSQTCCDNECRCARAFPRERGKELTEISYPSGYTDMPERSFRFLEGLTERAVLWWTKGRVFRFRREKGPSRAVLQLLQEWGRLLRMRPQEL